MSTAAYIWLQDNTHTAQHSTDTECILYILFFKILSGCSASNRDSPRRSSPELSAN